ncbi:PAS domain-containing sensor histidine kinase [Methanolobus psychrotolerans]|uniref:PAS domain-containing sensor histidine kinase n=1 Tax=Methanolobus psychrotolerans TaxID=1874706 RepID=UPI000B91AEE5|nr:ATP-binding protein [Methanolobus psychrotolerans]
MSFVFRKGGNNIKIDQEDMDPLRIKEWFKRPYSVTVTTVLIFILILYRGWLYIGNWIENVLVNGLVPGDVTFIKALTFILILLTANIIHMVLSRQVALLRTVEDQEQKLILSEMKFQSFIDNVHDVAVQGFGPDCTVHYWNCASEKMYGYSKSEATGKKMTELIVPAEGKSELDNIIVSAQNEKNYTNAFETTFLTKDKRKIPVFSSYSAVPVAEDQLEIFSMEIDLTERKTMEKVLKEAKELAEASNNAKSRFLASMSHEIRTPLNSIIGFSDILADEGLEPLSEKQKRYAQNISTSGHHLLGIINNILDISKAEAGKMELQYESISVSSIVHDVAESLKPSTDVRNISINVDTEPEDCTIEADSGKLKQILYNLIGNSVKFSSDSGNIVIRCRIVEDYVHFEVEDDGIGIKEQDLDRLFRPFSQIDTSSAGRYKGTGLGLSLVKELVGLHGGEVWVRSEYGKYSVFGFSIPVRRQNDEETA